MVQVGRILIKHQDIISFIFIAHYVKFDGEIIL